MIFHPDVLTIILPVQSTLPPLAVLALAFVIGACLGSFVQAAALRLNQDEDVIKQPSRCRSCGVALKWHDNLPVIGWLKTRGHCRQCGVSISPRYLWVEVFLGVMTTIMVASFPISIASALIIGIALITICVLTDFDAMLLHLPVMLVMGGVGVVLSFLPFWPLSPMAAILGMIAPLVLITVINLVYMVIRGETGFGSGDYWLLGAVGLWMGPIFSTALFFIAAILGAVIGIALISLKKGHGQTALPFGIFIGLVFICWPILNILVII